MPKHPLETERAPRPIGPYSQGWRAGDFVFCSGQGPLDPASGQMVPGGVEAQTRRVIENLRAVLAAAGADLGDVVKVTAHLADMGEFEAFNHAYRELFQPPYPARTTVASSLHGGIRVEIDVVAYVGER